MFWSITQNRSGWEQMVLSNHDVMASACGANEESSVGVITRLNGALQFHSQVETFF